MDNGTTPIDATTIIDKLLAGQAKVQRENAEMRAQIALLTRLVDSHQVEIEDLKLRLVTGGIVQ